MAIENGKTIRARIEVISYCHHLQSTSQEKEVSAIQIEFKGFESEN